MLACVCVCVLHAGTEAQALERALGVSVVRHTEKKPAGGAAELESHFAARLGPAAGDGASKADGGVPNGGSGGGEAAVGPVRAHELVMVGDR